MEAGSLDDGNSMTENFLLAVVLYPCDLFRYAVVILNLVFPIWANEVYNVVLKSFFDFSNLVRDQISNERKCWQMAQDLTAIIQSAVLFVEASLFYAN